MTNTNKYNTYQAVTLWHFFDGPGRFAYVYIHVHNAQLEQNLKISYEQGQKELAKLMLRLNKMPEVTKGDNYVMYNLDGFLD